MAREQVFRGATRVAACAASWLSCFGMASAQADEFIVTNDQLRGTGSFYAAVELANATQGPDTITFDTAFFATPRTIEVDKVAIRDSLTIRGPGRERLTLQGIAANATNAGKINLTAPAGTNSMTTVLEGLSVQAEDGAPSDRLFYAAHHNLTLRDVALSGGAGTYRNSGAAIAIVNAELDMEDVVVSNFHSALTGGTVVAWVNDTRHPSVRVLINLQRTAFRNNSTDGIGGALDVYANGIPDRFAVIVSGSEFSDNRAGYRGGAIFVNGAFDTSVSNSTFSGNTADSHYGGAIEVVNAEVSHAVLNVDDSTLTNNVAGQLGGAISSIGSNAPSIRTANSVIAGNFVSDGDAAVSQDVYAEDGFLVSHSLVGDHVGSNPALTILEHDTTVGSTLLDADPMLAPLADNGGATRTHAIRAGSPLLDAGNANAPTRDRSLPQPTTDQRGAGFPRQSGTAVDIGAYEFQVSGGSGGGGPGGGSGGGSIGGWTIGWLIALVGLVALRRSGADIRQGRTLLRIPVLLAGVLLLSAFRHTLVDGRTDPDFEGYRFDTVVVRIETNSLPFKQLVEERLRKQLEKRKIRMLIFTDLFPPTREWTPEQVKDTYVRNNVDASLAIIVAGSNYYESPGMVLYDTTTVGGMTYGTGHVVTAVSDEASFDITLVDAASERVAWAGRLHTRGNGALFIGNKSTAKHLVKSLVEEWQATGLLGR